MELKRRALLIGGVLLWGATAAAMADSASSADISAQLDALKAQVAAQQAQIAGLQAQTDQKWLNEQRSEEIKGLIRDTLADADTRASLESDGAVAGNDGQFFIKTADDSFRLNIGGLVQVRYIENLRGTSPNSADAGHENGFQMRRIEMDFNGYIGNPNLDYAITARADDGDTGVILAEIGHKFDLGNDQSVRIFGGRFYDRFSREAMMGAGMQQTVERSAADYIFAANDDITEGLGVEWNPLPEYLKVAATFNNGIGAGSDASSPLASGLGSDFDSASNADYAFSARGDIKIAGDWKEASDVESWSTNPDLQVFVGGGFHYQKAKQNSTVSYLTESSNGLGSEVNSLEGLLPAQERQSLSSSGLTGDTVQLGDTYEWTADTLIKYHGFGLMATGYGLYLDNLTVASNGTISSPYGLTLYGATVQAGYTIADKFEPFARYEFIYPDSALTAGQYNGHQLNLLTFGANYFIKKHVAKLTVDCVWALNNVNASNTFGTGLAGTGLLLDEPNRTGQVVIRAQFQLMF